MDYYITKSAPDAITVQPIGERTAAQKDFAFMSRYVPEDEQKHVRGRLKLIALLATKPNAERWAEEGGKIAAEYELTNWSIKSVYRWAKDFDIERPYTSVLDDRTRRRVTALGLATNEPFVAYFQELCLQHKRSTEQAIVDLHNRLAAGESIPGVGDWRTLWAKENGGVEPEPGARCPYGQALRWPKGFSERNLRRLSPDHFAIDAMRRGNLASAMENLPDVLRTREGLRSCQVVQIDDMWYEQKVAFKGNKHAERVLEYSAIDVLTGHVFARLMKPVIEANGALTTLKSKWTRYLIAYTLCDVGIPETGIVFQGEHGTATLDQPTIELLHEISGGRIRFTAGGMLDKPMLAGLDRCRPKGNPKFKGLIEGFHSLIKNRLGAAKGQMGGGRDRQPEWVYGMEQKDEQLRRWCEVAEQHRPGITERLKFPFPFYDDFAFVAAQAYVEIDRMRNHDLGDWEKCGFLTMFWKASAAALDWEPASKLEQYPEAVRALMNDTFKQKPELCKFVRMSRGEAWTARAADRAWKLGPEVAVSVMGMQLSQTCLCNRKRQLRFRDPETMTDEIISGLLDGGTMLDADKSYLVWLNPCNLKAYVADMQGCFLGTAHVMHRASYADDEAVKEQLGIREAVKAAEIRKAMPALRRMQAKAAADLAHNVTVMTGSDPYAESQLDAAANAVLEDAGSEEILDFSGNADDALDEGSPVEFNPSDFI